jgi:hypothetical protein
MDECYEKVVGQVPAISTLKRKADLQIRSPVVPGGPRWLDGCLVPCPCLPWWWWVCLLVWLP